MNRESFLLKMLGAIFAIQAAFLLVGIGVCARAGVDACPNLGNRYEKTFNVMIATTLALLTGVSMSKDK